MFLSIVNTIFFLGFGIYYFYPHPLLKLAVAIAALILGIASLIALIRASRRV